MAGQTWSINIIAGNPLASFVPDVYTESGEPSTALQAQTGDAVSWNDQTGDFHQICLKDTTTTPATITDITDEIPKYGSSTPAFVIAAPSAIPATVTYYCARHDGEEGTIEVVA